VLLKLLQLELNDRPPASIEKIQLQLTPVELRTTQHGLFVPAAPEPEKLEITLARIRALVGKENVGAAELLNTYRPNSFCLRSPKIAGSSTSPLHPKLMLRRFRPPCHAQVWCTDGKPTRIHSSQGQGRVIACAGPWCMSGDWWTSEIWDQQNWDIEIQRTDMFRVYQDSQAHWFIAGIMIEG
jgi:protein ImuB